MIGSAMPRSHRSAPLPNPMTSSSECPMFRTGTIRAVDRLLLKNGGIDGGQQAERRQRPQGRGEKTYSAEEPADQDGDEAQQEGRSVHGGEEEREKIQGRSKGEVVTKLLVVAAIVLTLLIAFSAWV